MSSDELYEGFKRDSLSGNKKPEAPLCAPDEKKQEGERYKLDDEYLDVYQGKQFIFSLGFSKTIAETEQRSKAEFIVSKINSIPLPDKSGGEQQREWFHPECICMDCKDLRKRTDSVSASVEKPEKKDITSSIRCQKEQEGGEKCHTVCYKCLTTKVY